MSNERLLNEAIAMKEDARRELAAMPLMEKLEVVREMQRLENDVRVATGREPLPEWEEDERSLGTEEKKPHLLTDEMWPILEGGKAIGGEKINKEDIKNTMDYFEETVLQPVLGLSQDDCALVGSTGKKPQSGDIDLAIPFNDFGVDEDKFFHHYPKYLAKVFDKVKEISPESKLNLVFKQIHAATPIVDKFGRVTDKVAQVDMIFGSMPFLQWALYSDPAVTKFESWVRNALFTALSRTRILYTMDDLKVVYEDRLSYNANSGLVSKLEYRFKGTHANEPARLLNIDLLTSNPKEVLEGLFDEQLDPGEMLTPEAVIEAIVKGITEGRIDKDKMIKEFEAIMLEEKKELPEVIAAFMNA